MQEDKSQEREFEFRNEENQEAGKGENDERINEEYNSNEYISRAKRVQNGTVPMNILEFQYPFYICSDYYRLFFLFKSYCAMANVQYQKKISYT